MSKLLRRTEEFIMFDEAQAEALIESMREDAFSEGYELIGYSTTKKSKKNVEYYIVKIVKEFAKEKELVSE